MGQFKAWPSWIIAIGHVSGHVIRRAPDTHVLHEERTQHPSLNMRDRLHQETPLLVKIALKQSNMDQAESWLHDVASPESPNFGKHWTLEQVTEAFRPPQDAVDAVIDWLHSSGVHRDNVTHSDNKQWLVFPCSAEQAETLFHTDYYEYHDLEGRSLAGNEGYHLPRDISDVVDFVKPGVVTVPFRRVQDRDKSHSAHQRRANAAPSQHRPKKEVDPLKVSQVQDSSRSCANEVTPECLTKLLNMPFLTGKPGPDSPTSFGTYQHGQYYEQADLDLYWNEFFPSRISKGYGPIFASIDGGLRYEQLLEWTGNGGGEVALDLQSTMPLYYPGNVTNIQVDDEYYGQDRNPALLTSVLDAIDGSYCKSCANGICGPFDPEFDPTYPDTTPVVPPSGTSGSPGNNYNGTYQCGTWKPPAVIASSYYTSLGEPNAHAKNHATRQCDEILKLGLQGITFLFASGDRGVGYGDTCKSFGSNYPNGCPWILVVGGTMIGSQKTEYDTEVTWQTGPAGNQPWKGSFSSGSGFSQFFERPSYQATAVDKYLKSHDQSYPYWEGTNYNHTKPGLYNRAGRAYPDVAANAGPVG
ncbi:Protease s8 tripeptidyl peptidase protein [Pyrenophora teres f. maculata]|nr:Protease s8 tripeptidyl peptidase protein [Pyrenophora teres f. maculata]